MFRFVIGNFMTKTRKHGVVGLRVVWSMYNDITWAKSNRFGGVALIIVGILTIITSIFVEVSILVYKFNHNAYIFIQSV